MGFEGLIAVGQSMGIDIDVNMLNVLLWAVITIYGINGICHFYTALPEPKLDDEEEVLHTQKPNFLFWITTSLIYFFYGLSQLTQPILIWLTLIEMVLIVISYFLLSFKKNSYRKEKEAILRDYNKCH